MARVVEFELKAIVPERAIAFLERCFGWRFEAQEGSNDRWVITTGKDTAPGMNGRLIKFPPPKDYDVMMVHMFTIEVASIGEAESAVTENAGTIIIPSTAIPGEGWQFIARDTEGNTLMVKQSDPAVT